MIEVVKSVVSTPTAVAPATINETHWKPEREIFLGWCGMVFTLIASTVVVWEQSVLINQQIDSARWGDVVMHLSFALIVVALIYGSLVYQVTRLGYLKRRQQHRPVHDDLLNSTFMERNSVEPLALLVPSYKEERRIIFQTLMSAALQEYPNRRVVLLIDNPPMPKDMVDVALLAEARALPQQITAMLKKAGACYQTALVDFLARKGDGPLNFSAEVTVLVQLWCQAAEWFEVQAREYAINDHTDFLYVDKVLKGRAVSHRRQAQHLRESFDNSHPLSEAVIASHYYKLVALFDCEVSSFERKRYENLSHEPNKAMNLNSYIGLVGRCFSERKTEQALFLDEVVKEKAELTFPTCRYFVTLDADSILLPEYALRLIHVMEQPGNERIAVAQTPYSAIPGSPSELERIAGATTDMQYIIHQGFTHHNATYWVGANALLRYEALQEIVITTEERGYPVQRFIQDRTVIEDTESSVDLAMRGWTLYNYPERLAYSATPPDFGSLLIQRRRWANGGLIILPKLLRYLAKAPHRKMTEGLLRVHYLISIAAVNIGLLILLAFPFSSSINSIWLPLSALPYFFLYGRDMVLCGYKASDLLRVYALNLLMIPVNLGGVLKSIQQGITGKQIPFGRTPKVEGRTAAAPLYVLAAYLLFAQWVTGAAFDVYEGHIAHAIFAALNATLLLYGIRVFIGYKESCQDLFSARLKVSSPTVRIIRVSQNNDVSVVDVNLDSMAVNEATGNVRVASKNG